MRMQVGIRAHGVAVSALGLLLSLVAVSCSAIAGRADTPVNYVSFYDSLRFTSGLNNGQDGGDTETGAYTLLGGTATPSNGTTVTRNAGANIVLTSENERYKPAYQNAVSTSYFADPAGSNTQTVCATPTATANRAHCNNAVGDLTVKGNYTGSANPYGSFDQGGNVWEWNEAIISGSYRGRRGGAFGVGADFHAASYRLGSDPTRRFADALQCDVSRYFASIDHEILIAGEHDILGFDEEAESRARSRL
jgi:hypothetical protein